MVAINAVNGVGEPSYTSGVQKCIGAALTLNPKATSINNTPTTPIIFKVPVA
ncbi:hypothetical protein D3C80_2200280 [compost metagenome]